MLSRRFDPNTMTDTTRLPPAHADALAHLLDRTSDRTIDWALTGSTSFALQGLPFEPNDIDVQTDRIGAHRLADLFDTAHRPLTYVEGDYMRSWLGSYRLNGVEIEVIGALEKRIDDRWIGPVDIREHRDWIRWRDHLVPVLSLAYESEAYEQIGRTVRAAQLRDWLA